MQVKWLGDDREIVVPNDDGTTAQVDVSRGDVVEVPQGIARSLIKQELAEAHPVEKSKTKGDAK